jgi:predicted transcriptional regulator of viral defense system
MSNETKTKDRILGYVEKNGEITTAQANDMCAGLYYHNGQHHIQAVLARLVKNGTLKREQKGVYIKAKTIETNENQQTLWGE